MPKSKSNDITELWRSLRIVGLNRLGVRLVWFSIVSFVSGLAQAGLLILISSCAISAAEGHHALRVHGYTLSFGSAIIYSFGLLLVCIVSGVCAALMSSALTAAGYRAAQKSIVTSYFAAQWSVQAEERLGNVQQLLSMNAIQVAILMASLTRGIQSLLTLVALLGVAVGVNVLAALAIIAAGCVLALIMRPLNRMSRAASDRFAASSQALSTQTTEYTRVARELRLFGVERRAVRELMRGVDRASGIYRHALDLQYLSPVIYQSVALGLVVGAVGLVAAHETGNLTSFGAVLLLILRSLSSTSGLQGMSQGVRASQGFLDELVTTVERFRAQRNRRARDVAMPLKFDLEFDRVSFSYDQRTSALDSVTLRVPQGATVGILGRSGSGKTTFSQLALGIRGPSSGHVLVGGCDATALLGSEDATVTAFVPQEPILLQGTVAFNIAFFRDVSQAAIESAARAANLHDEILRMADGYSSLVGEGGGGALSGGQKQRLAIARALVGTPKLLVLDEPTSALDARSEHLIGETLQGLRGAVTTLVISHRLATVDRCDLLLILERGKVADFGPRDEVAQRDPFRHIWTSTARSGQPASPLGVEFTAEPRP